MPQGVIGILLWALFEALFFFFSKGIHHPMKGTVKLTSNKRFNKPLFLISLLLLVQILFPTWTAFAATTGGSMLPPSNLSTQLLTPSDVKLTWGSVYGATGYKVYSISDGQLLLLGTTTATFYTINKLSEGSYSYVVSTLSPEGESGPSAPVTADIVYPDMAAPTALAYKFQNGNDIVLSWGSSPYAQSYQVYQIQADGQKTLVTQTTARTYTIVNASAGTYTYAVSASNNLYGESPLSEPVEATVVLPIMTAPANFTHTLSNVNTVNLKWNAVPYATDYRIYQIVDGQPTLKSTLTGTSVSYASQPAGDYVYEVRSFSNRYGESATGSQVSLTVASVTMTAPENFVYQIKNVNDIVLTWAAVSNANSYKIYQIINGQKTLKSTVSGTTITYANMPAGDIAFEVHSYSSSLGESSDGSSVSLTLVHPVMQPPANLVQTIVSATSFKLSWTASENATSYKVYQILNGQKTLKSTVSGTSVSYTNMSPGEYAYEVHSVSSRFGESSEGSQITFTLNGQVMEAPANPAYSVTNGNDITLKWTAVNYATNYRVYQVVDGSEVLKSTVAGTSVPYTNQPAGDYHYVIRSYSTLLGESPEGAEIAFTLVYPTMAAPGGLTYKIQNGNDVVLTWTAVPYATSYQVNELVDGQEVPRKSATSLSVLLANETEGDHVYIVRSVSTRFGVSPEGSQVSVPLVFPDMAAPANLTSSIANGNDITLRWNAVTYANAYNVYQIVDGQPVFQRKVTGTSTIFSKMPFGDYVFEVRSYSDRFGESQNGSSVNVTISDQTMLPPGNLTYSIANGNDIGLKWNAVSYATAYKVYQLVDGQPVLKKTVTSLSTALPNMPAGDYKFIVHSYSDRFGESPEGSELTFTLVHPVMQAPTDATYSITNGNDIVLRWKAAAYANSYKIYAIENGQKVLSKTVTGTSVTFTNMPEGDYSYEIHSSSSRFGESTEGGIVSLTLTWPVVQPPVLKYTVSNVNNITFTWQAVTWANEYRLYEWVNGNRQLLYKGKALTYKAFNLTEGTHEYELTAFSTRFGESAASNRVAETIIYPDMQAPTANLKLLSQTSAQISWNFVTYSNGYNVYEIVDGKPVLLIHNLNNLSYTVSDLPYADHQYYVTSYSNSFGESEPSNIVLAKLIVDTTAPITTANAPAGWTNQSANVTFTAADDETGVAGTYYAVDGQPFVEGNALMIETEGIHSVSFYSIDKAGNKENLRTIEVKIDRTAPVTSADSPSAWVKEDVTVKLTSSDSGSGVATTFYSVDGSEFVEGSSFTISQEGIHTVSYYSVDQAGNEETKQAAEVKIDRTAPIVQMDLGGEHALGGKLTLHYAAEDTLSGIAFEKMTVSEPDGTSVTSANGDILSLDKPGIYSIVVTAADGAGWSTTVEKQITVYIPATMEVTPKVIKGNKGVFTVRVKLPSGFDPRGFDLSTVTVNGVKALDGGNGGNGNQVRDDDEDQDERNKSSNGYLNQAQKGQFKFDRSQFIWTGSEVALEFRGYVDGNLVIAHKTVKLSNGNGEDGDNEDDEDDEKGSSKKSDD
ncbi:OmpL47-type beta-barrel domain-containing protein [Cohnella luojiensis]|uniref:OmpL47-type beta-barrel domain-containing protein n=1 Tax=Cohnella luojiensis TaxID=652876 RepID=UPI001F101BC1|nr:hypothetical protein [Cohnella luojiensis]